MFIYKKWFTLVEIMIVLMILAILFTALYMWTQPYMMRSRDTKRVTSLLQYTNIIEWYEKDFETFPSNYGSWWAFTLWYCLSEIASRSNVWTAKDMQFSALTNNTAKSPTDPVSSRLPISPCNQNGSFFYSKMVYNTVNEIAILAANLEMRSSANYGTWSDLSAYNPGTQAPQAHIDKIINAQKSSIPNGAPDQIFVVTRIR